MVITHVDSRYEIIRSRANLPTSRSDHASERGGIGGFSWAAGAKTEVIRDAFKRIGSPFRIKELEALCPTVSRDMIRVVLNELKDEELLYAQGRGVATEWVKPDAQE